MYWISLINENTSELQSRSVIVFKHSCCDAFSFTSLVTVHPTPPTDCPSADRRVDVWTDIVTRNPSPAHAFRAGREPNVMSLVRKVLHTHSRCIFWLTGGNVCLKLWCHVILWQIPSFRSHDCMVITIFYRLL